MKLCMKLLYLTNTDDFYTGGVTLGICFFISFDFNFLKYCYQFSKHN